MCHTDCSKLDHLGHFKGSNALAGGSDGLKRANGWKQVGSHDKKAAIDAEIARVNKLPPNSSYAVHRMRVLNKLLHLMAIQEIRTAS